MVYSTQHLKPEDLRKGLTNYHGEFPPNLVQFYDACTAKPIGKPAPCYKLYQSEPDRRQIEHKPSKEKGNEILNKIREEFL